MTQLNWIWFKGEENEKWLRYGSPFSCEEAELATLESVTLEQLCNHLDQGAESDNFHRFVGVHRCLAALIVQSNGYEAAKSILFGIANLGGLQNFTNSEIFEKLKINQCCKELIFPGKEAE